MWKRKWNCLPAACRRRLNWQLSGGKKRLLVLCIQWKCLLPWRERRKLGYSHPAYKASPATSSITRKPAIRMQPQRWLSPSFFLVNLMSESDDMIDSDLWCDGLKLFLNSWLQTLFLRSVLVLLFLCTTWWWCRWKFGWLNCWLFKIWSFKSFNFSLFSIRLSLIEMGEDDVVAVELEAEDVDESFFVDFFSFWWWGREERGSVSLIVSYVKLFPLNQMQQN